MICDLHRKGRIMSVQKTNFTFPSASKAGVDIQCFQWKDDTKKSLGIVHITHGLSQNTEMFEEVAMYLAEHGYVCVGLDLLGHGATAGAGLAGITPSDTNTAVWKDIFTLYNLMRDKYPGLPYFMYGHSMGSTITRAFLVKYRDKIDIKACFLSADSSLPSITYLLIPPAYVLGRLISRWPSALEKRRAKFVLKNCGNHPPILLRLLLSWLSFDQQHLFDYINSPYCGINADYRHIVGFVMKGFTTFALADKKGWENKIPDNTVIHHGCGRWDMMGYFGAGPKMLHKKLLAAGKKTELKLYDHAMHEVYAESAVKDQFNADMLKLFNDNNPLCK